MEISAFVHSGSIINNRPKQWYKARLNYTVTVFVILSRNVRKLTFEHLRPAKIQSLRIRAVW